ncbi:hypothetical protein ISS30_03325 [bacterium]|nr:hypothetical protein [bacterium]
MTERITNIVELVKEMGNDEKLELISQLVGRDLLTDILEDIEDMLLYVSRREEPAEDFQDFLEKLRQEGRPV